MAKKKSQLVSIQPNVPVRIPIPQQLQDIVDPTEKRDALEACWLSYGYNEQYAMVRIENGHFIMMRRQ